jgi:hypothetical protein
LIQLKNLYEALRITDPTFLHLRGVPFFSTFLEMSPGIIKAAMALKEARLWYEPMFEKIDEEGQSALTSMLKIEFAD